MHYQGTGWRGYETYIGNKILYPGFSESMRNAVFTSRAVQDHIDQLAYEQTKHLSGKQAKKQYQARRKELEAMAHKIIAGCVATQDSRPKLRLLLSAVDLLLARLYHHGVYIEENQWVELKRVAMHAEKNNLPLILLPAHRSHIDYLVINFIMVRLGLQMPHIIAGENMDIPVLGSLLKAVGAVYIRREWGNDVMYKTILDEYISVLLSRGMNFQCFVEGTRSRLGKLLPPKLGILKIVLDAFIKNRFPDCYIVPMSAGYDKIIETSSYAGELLGTPKEKESLVGLIGNASLLQQRMGRVDIRIGKPYSLKEWMQEQIQSRGPMDLQNNPADKALILKSLGYRVLADINAISPIMPAALVGTVILTLRGRGVGRTELIRRVEWLTRMIHAKKGPVVEVPEISTEELVDRAISIHPDLIGMQKDKDILEPTFYGIDRFELSYYRNQVIHLFIDEAILCASLYTIIKKGGGINDQRMQYNDLLHEIIFLSSMLKIEMIYKPGGVEANMQRALDWLIEHKVLQMSDDGWIGLSDEERSCGRENYDFLCFLIWPFIDSYWLACVSLFTLTPPSKSPQNEPIYVDSKAFMARTQALGKTLYYQGDLSYLEAVNKETVSTAFSRFQQSGILLVKQYKEPKPWSEVALDVKYIPDRYSSVLVPRGRLWDLAEHLGKFRREGKNRRDNAAVSSRVLRLAHELAEENGELSANQKNLQKKMAKAKL
ncbi:glycerol-3-phosphate acyltransferase protein [Lichtheimia corymbifera JMRC:FSU:9682]|uniref:Glycerol-3-phosphate acyltransferase protein n=1 Tax=Lichtheimia corymbifera JMRC:FSU:9682 TaxID=1263082 RepID=A0A068S1M0_9FUNG|nr:glycerol-3-phosphate acyltransferase protein [Lichtheimia corymbifera JMRC:FSU:9682]